MDIDEDFFKRHEGQFIIGAHRYIRAASVVRYSEQWSTEAELLKVPTLHLLCHGIELLLKYRLLRSGISQQEILETFGHDLNQLWETSENEPLRAVVMTTVEGRWDEERNSGRWPNDDFDRDPRQAVIEAIRMLSAIHGKKSGFALRYTIDREWPAPQSAFLIDTFGDVAEKTAMNPQYLDL